MTVALLGASLALVLGIYLRDRDTSWRPPERVTADFDARWLLGFIAGNSCGDRCGYKLLAHPRAGHWLAWINDRSRTQCVDIDVARFDVTATHGILGATRVPCDIPLQAFPDR